MEEKYKKAKQILEKYNQTHLVAQYEKLDNDKKEYLSNYMNKYYSDEYIDTLVNQYNTLLFSKVEEIKQLVESLKYYLDDKNYAKYLDYINPTINSRTYNDIKFNYVY